MALRGIEGLRGWPVAAALAFAASFVALPAAAQSTDFVGQWHWNRAESTPAGDQPPPRMVVLDITAAEPGHVQWRLTGTDIRGQPHVETYNGTGDGKPAPVGGAPEGTVASFTLTSRGMETSYVNRDGSSERTTCSITRGRDRLICFGSDNDGKGHVSSFRDIYDRW